MPFFAIQFNAFSQGQTRFPDVNGQNLLQNTDTLQISSTVRIKNLPMANYNTPGNNGNGNGGAPGLQGKFRFVMIDESGLLRLGREKKVGVPPDIYIPPPGKPGTFDWHLDGNNIDNIHFLGTLSGNPDPLIIKTNGEERMRITADGELGIGTVSPDPDSKLHIVPDHPQFFGSRTGLFIDAPMLVDKGTITALQATGGSNTMYSLGGTYLARIGQVTNISTYGRIIGGVFGYVKPNRLRSNSTIPSIASGIACIAELDDIYVSIGSGKNWAGGLYSELKGTITKYPEIGFGAIAAVIGIDKIKQFDPSTGQHTYAGYFEGKVHIGEGKTITAGTHTDAQLFVDGKIVAKRTLTTQVNWADDELKKDLTLEEDLIEDERYKDNYGHLKGVKSGKVIEKEGLDLAEMDATQMRLIERVFLYLFKFNKVVHELQATIFDIKNDNRQLKKSNKKIEKENQKLKEGYNDLLKRVETLEKKAE